MKHKTAKQLEGIIDALNDSLEIVAHNPAETEYIIKLKDFYQHHYKRVTGHYYARREM